MNKILYPPLIIVGIIIPIKYNKRTVPLLQFTHRIRTVFFWDASEKRHSYQTFFTNNRN